MNNTQPANYTADPEHTDYLLRYQAMNLEAGILGRFFGSTQSAASSIAWIMIFLLVCSGIGVSFLGSNIQPLDYWKTIGPLITLPLGYLFGKTGK